MKFIKLYESFEDIDSICIKYGIQNYTINSDGKVDVDGLVTFYGCNLTKLPLKFGDVTGNFHCGANNLKSLEGCPQSVGGYFYCNHNKLTTLEGCPKSISGDFDCISNMLKTLEFCPKLVGGDFNCYNNNLKNLYGFPEFFDSDFYYAANPVQEILDLFNINKLGKVIDLINEYGVIQQDGKLVILDRLEEVFYTSNMEIPDINLKNYEVY